MPELKPEQIKAINHDSGNVMVSASAGSGKTFVMISRLIRLITEKKTTVKEVLAMTFTESAAQDMKDKLYKAMTDAIEKTGDETLVEQLSEIPYSDISTIDSFCSRLVRRYFYEAGVSQDYSIADETLSGKLKKEAIDKTFKEYYASKDKDFLTVNKRHSSHRKDDKFRELVLFLYEYVSSEGDAASFFAKSFENYSLKGFEDTDKKYKQLIDKELARYKQEFLGYAKQASEAGIKKGVESCLAVADFLENYLRSQSVYSLKETPFKITLSFGKTENLDFFGNELKEKCKSRKAALSKFIKGVADNLSTKENDLKSLEQLRFHTEKIAEIVDSFTRNYAKIKREENVLDFADLERFALNVLSDETIRKEVSEKYKYVFIDEYQDINGVQEAIITRIAKDNLFMVGDVKQSIYGFRGCRPEFFSEKFKKMQESGQTVINLNHNFRSANKVIECVNEVFSYSMTEEFYGQSYKDTALLNAGGVYGDNEGRAELHFLIEPKPMEETEEPRIYDILEELKKDTEKKDKSSAAGLVANIIFNETGKDYYDPKTKENKRVEFKDIAVLTRNKNAEFVQELVKGLSLRGIPISTDTASSVVDLPEIKPVVCLLELLDCFLNDVPLCTVMKSPMGGFTDEELLTIQREYYNSRKAEEKKDGYFYQAAEYVKNGDFALSEKVKDFYGYIEYLRELADCLPAKDVLEKAIEDSAYYECLLAKGNGERHAENLRFFISCAQKNGKNYTVKEFLNLIKINPYAFCYSGASEDENVVSLMTIHASKGLEFPVVIVCGLEKKINEEDLKNEILTDREAGFAVRKYDDELKTYGSTIYRGYLKQKAKINIIKEELRLFYVALTRASYSLHLAVVAEWDDRKDVFSGATRFLDYLPKSLPATFYTKDTLEFFNRKEGPRKVLIGEEEKELYEKMKSNFSYCYPFAEQTALPLKTTVTAVNEGMERDYKEIIAFDEKEDLPSTSAMAGTAAHRILELYDFDRMPNIADAVKEFVKKGLIKDEEVAFVSLEKIQFAIDGGAFDGLKGKTLYREKDFLVNVPANLLYGVQTEETVLIQGKIDLLAIGKDSCDIIDYKYSSLPATVLKEKYSKQLELYAYAVEKVLNIKVSSKYVISLLTGETVLID